MLQGPCQTLPQLKMGLPGRGHTGWQGHPHGQCRGTTTVLPIPTSRTHTDRCWEVGNLYWVWRWQERLIWGHMVLAQATSTGPQVQKRPPSTPGWAVPPRLVPLVIRMPPQKPHVNPSSHDTPPSACGDLVIPGGPGPLLAPGPHQPLAGNSYVTHSPSKPLARRSFSQSSPHFPFSSHLPLRSEEQKARAGTVTHMSPMTGWLKSPLQESS